MREQPQELLTGELLPEEISRDSILFKGSREISDTLLVELSSKAVNRKLISEEK